MKKEISTDEYLQALALVHMETDLRKQSDKYGNALEKLFELDGDKDPSIWDYLFEDDTPTEILGDWIKSNDIIVSGRKH